MPAVLVPFVIVTGRQESPAPGGCENIHLPGNPAATKYGYPFHMYAGKVGFEVPRVGVAERVALVIG